ncbi:MAG: methionine/alanine import family NSS transporter small subunit [Bacillaceae bacterium]|nr:methionine/alanine import family NSS transporter small subunit [Bacillaceae bacterium]
MSTSAIVMMLVGMVVIWGGLAASVVHAISSSGKRN